MTVVAGCYRSLLDEVMIRLNDLTTTIITGINRNEMPPKVTVLRDVVQRNVKSLALLNYIRIPTI
jgi:hypothetical protein